MTPPKDDFAGSEEQMEYVPAVFARSMDEAETYRQLLEDHDIPATVGATDDLDPAQRPRTSRITRGVPVLVPEALLDEASEVIADREESEFKSPNDDFDDEEEEEFEGQELDATGLNLEEDSEDEEEDEFHPEDEEDEEFDLGEEDEEEEEDEF